MYLLANNYVYIIIGRTLSGMSYGILDISRRQALENDPTIETQHVSIYYKMSYFFPTVFGTGIYFISHHRII
jgi:hypothetical protein